MVGFKILIDLDSLHQQMSQMFSNNSGNNNRKYLLFSCAYVMSAAKYSNIQSYWQIFHLLPNILLPRYVVVTYPTQLNQIELTTRTFSIQAQHIGEANRSSKCGSR
jgi:hypothetical protein